MPWIAPDFDYPKRLDLPTGTIYPALHRLEEAGLIEGSWSVVGGRRQFHTPEFLMEEAAFEHYHRSRRWERENLDRLLVY